MYTGRCLKTTSFNLYVVVWAMLRASSRLQKPPPSVPPKALSFRAWNCFGKLTG